MKLFHNVLEIGGKMRDGRFSMLATLTKGAEAKSAFENAELVVALPDFTLFNILSLSDLRIFYLMGKAKQLDISSSVSVTLFSRDISFKGQLHVTDDRLTAMIESKEELPDLFGGKMKSISFSDLSLNVDHRFTEPHDTVVYFGGKAEFCTFICSGELYILSGAQKFARVIADDDFNIATFIKQVTSLNFPSNMVNITLKKGSELYYNATDKPFSLNSKSYKPGFNLYARIVFDIWRIHLDFSGDINIDGDKVTAAINMQDIDFYIVKFVHVRLNIEVTNNTKTLGLSAVIHFLGGGLLQRRHPFQQGG